MASGLPRRTRCPEIGNPQSRPADGYTGLRVGKRAWSRNADAPVMTSLLPASCHAEVSTCSRRRTALFSLVIAATACLLHLRGDLLRLHASASNDRRHQRSRDARSSHRRARGGMPVGDSSSSSTAATRVSSPGVSLHSHRLMARPTTGPCALTHDAGCALSLRMRQGSAFRLMPSILATEAIATVGQPS